MDALDALLPATTRSADETLALGRRIGAALQPGDVLALTGDLGAGKTHLAKGIVAGLGGRAEAVASPTFALVHEHATDPPLRHLDLYRLDTPAALASIGLDEILADLDAVALIEWPERAADRLPPEAVWLRLRHGSGDVRWVERAEPPASGGSPASGGGPA